MQVKMETQIKNYAMKWLALLIFSVNTYAVCDTQISRTNFSPNTVLTANDLNSQFNTVYNRANDFPGDCIEDNTIDLDKLKTSDSTNLTDAVKAGCKLQYNNASTVNVSECTLGLGTTIVETTSDTSVSFGCTGCSAEATATEYYIYADNTSTASSLDLLILTTTPDDKGKNGSDKVLGKFLNDSSGDIAPYSLSQWAGNDFIQAIAFNGYHDDSCSWSSTSGTYSDFADDATCSFVERMSVGGISCNKTGSVSPALSCTLPEHGAYLVCASAHAYNNTTGDGAIRLSDGTNVLADAMVYLNVSNSNRMLCGIYPSTSLTPTFKLQAKTTNTLSLTGSAGSAEQPLNWTVFKL